MKFIKPSEISSKIMTLFEESDEFVVIVSPYVKISKWYKLIKKFENLDARKIPVEFYIRDDRTNENSFNELDRLGIKYTAIPDLHCKLYFNEKTAIVSSMNLLLSSEINSLELGYQTQSKDEYNEILDFYNRYLKKESKILETKDQLQQDVQLDTNWIQYLGETLYSIQNYSPNIFLQDGTLNIRTRINTYNCFIWNNRINRFRISGILSGSEYDYIKENRQNLQNDNYDFDLIEGKRGYYNEFQGTLKNPLKSRMLEELEYTESKLVANVIIEFIELTETLKRKA